MVFIFLQITVSFRGLFRTRLFCLNRFMVGHDGKTAYERLRGTKFQKRLCTFGECILALKSKHTDDNHKNKLESRWFEAVYLGIHNVSGMILVGTPEGVRRVRTIKRLAEDKRWNLEFFNSIHGSPWKYKYEQKSDDVVPPEMVFGPANEPVAVGDSLPRPVPEGGMWSHVLLTYAVLT